MHRAHPPGVVLYRVFHSGVDWHITYNISETHVCIKTKFCTCVHELFTSNFWFNNFFLRPLTLAVLIRYYVYFDDFLKAFYVFLKFSPFWNCPRIFRYFIGCKLIFYRFVCWLICHGTCWIIQEVFEPRMSGPHPLQIAILWIMQSGASWSHEIVPSHIHLSICWRQVWRKHGPR